MKKVMHLFPAYNIGGAPINILRFIKGSKGRVLNYSAALVIDEQIYNEYRINSEESININLTKFSIKSYFDLLSAIKRVKPDIIHANGKGGALYAFLLVPFHKCNIFYTFRGFYHKYEGVKHIVYLNFEKFFSKFYKKAIAVSKSERMFFLNTVGIQENKVVIIENGVSISKEKLPDKINRACGDYKYNLVTLSRICHIKDLETMMMAIEVLDNEDVALHIMGGYLPTDLEYKIKLEILLKSLKCRNRIFLWGDIPKAANLLHNFDLYISTSLSEGLPTAIIEAGLSGVMVVGTNCNGNIDLIEDGMTGYIFPVKDVIALAKIIKSVLEDFNSNAQKEIISNNLNQMQGYSVDKNCNKILNLYEGIENTTN